MNALYPTLGICSNLALFRALVLDESSAIFIFLSTVILPLSVLKGLNKQPPLHTPCLPVMASSSRPASLDQL